MKASMRLSRRGQASWGPGGVLYVGGVAKMGPPPSAWTPSPYVGAPIPYFPVVPAQAPNQPNPAPQPLPPAVSVPSLLAKESAAANAALAAELQGMIHTIGGGPDFAKAASAWNDAMQAASAIASVALTSAPVASKNAATRAYHYFFRKGIDEQVASGQKPHPVASGEISNPNYGWSWPPIPQDPEPISPSTQAPLPGPSPEPAPAPSSGGSGTLLAIGLGLLAVAAAVVYAGSRAGS